MSNNIYEATPRRTREYVMDCIEAGLVPFVKSSPGMGKSSIMRSIAQHYGLYLIDHRLSTSQPEDLSGLPEFVTLDAGTDYERRRARFTPFDLFPGKDTPVPKGYDGWMIFFDEMNSAETDVQAACYKPILDKIVGQMPLHERCVITAAGNLSTDKAIVNDISTAMQSRVVHIKMALSHEEWVEDVAITEDYDERIIGYNHFDPDALMNFKPDHQDETFTCPRTWEFMNKLVKDKEVTDRKTTLYTGAIGQDHGSAFVAYSHLHGQIMTLKDVLADPENAPVYNEYDEGGSQKLWGITTHLMKHVDDKNIGDICIYINKLGLTHRILFYRRTMAKLPHLRQHPAFIKGAASIAHHMRPDDYDAANAHRTERRSLTA
jgi:hypothetical protein